MASRGEDTYHDSTEPSRQRTAPASRSKSPSPSTIASGACAGLEKQLSCERLRVNLLVARRELVHVDTLDLYVARQRHTFLKQAAAELYVEEATIKRDLGRVLLQLEARQELLIREQLGPRTAQVPVMSQAEREEALQLLQDPQLIERILADYDACGLVGEETNKLVCYLACTSPAAAAAPLGVGAEQQCRRKDVAGGSHAAVDARRSASPLVGADQSVALLHGPPGS